MFAVTAPQAQAFLCWLLPISLPGLLVMEMPAAPRTLTWTPHLRPVLCGPGTLCSYLESVDRKLQACLLGEEILDLGGILQFFLGNPPDCKASPRVYEHPCSGLFPGGGRSCRRSWGPGTFPPPLHRHTELGRSWQMPVHAQASAQETCDRSKGTQTPQVSWPPWPSLHEKESKESATTP